MGIDPMVSRLMQLAVEAFGKPEIELVGDASPYRPWLNVPAFVTVMAHEGMDAEHRFGNPLYMVSSQMDEKRFRPKNNSVPVRMLRSITDPLRRTFFVRSGETPSTMNVLVNRIFYWLGY